MGLLRVILALSVVLAHVGPIFGTSLVPSRIAVETFFVISGFYMSMILRSKYRDARTFYLNRFLRLYPAYLLIVLSEWALFAFAWVYLGKTPINTWMAYYSDMQPWQSAMIVFSNWTIIGQDVLRLLHYKLGVGFSWMHFGPTDAPDGAKWIGEMQTIGQAWSLGTEIWFYLLAPALVLLSTRSLLLMAAASLALRVWMQSAEIDFSYFYFPPNLCLFLAGIVLERNKGAYAAQKPSLLYACCGVALVACLFFPSGLITGTIFQALLIATIPAFFELGRRSAFDDHIGSLSYPIYLSHGLIFTVLLKANVHSPLVAVIVTIAFSAAVYWFLEKPIDTIRQRIAREPGVHNALFISRSS